MRDRELERRQKKPDFCDETRLFCVLWRGYLSCKMDWSYPTLDAVAELVERESAVGKTAVCSLDSDSVNPYVYFYRDIIRNSATASIWGAVQPGSW